MVLMCSLLYSFMGYCYTTKAFTCQGQALSFDICPSIILPRVFVDFKSSSSKSIIRENFEFGANFEKDFKFPANFGRRLLGNDSLLPHAGSFNQDSGRKVNFSSVQKVNVISNYLMQK